MAEGDWIGAPWSSHINDRGTSYDISSRAGSSARKAYQEFFGKSDAEMKKATSGSSGISYSTVDNSSVNVNNNSNVDLSPLTRSLQSYIDATKQIASENSARSAEFAKEQRDWSANQAAIARDFNAAEAAKNRDWQQMMSNTAHQREVADLKAAGLNPILSAMNGNGAAVTSGASASASVPSGDKGEVDMSANASIVGLLSSMLSAQTQLQAANISARTQEAVADKYTAMQQLVSEMSNATSRANAQLAAETSRYGVDVSSWTTLSANEKSVAAQRYGAELQAAASRYGVELSTSNAYKIAMAQLDWQSQHPNNMWQILGEVLGGFGTSVSDIASTLKRLMGGSIDSAAAKDKASKEAAVKSFAETVLPKMPGPWKNQ